MRIPTNACCVGGPDRENMPVTGKVLLTVILVYGALGVFACIASFFHG